MAAEIVQGPSPSSSRKRGGRSFAEIGQTGIRRFGGYVREEFLTVLQGQRGVRTFREMADNDPIVGTGLLAINQVCRKASWFIEPVSESNDDKRAAEFVHENMGDMSHSWSDSISENLSCLDYGWAFHEIVYKLRKGDTNDPRTSSRFNDGLIGWRKLPARLQSSLVEWIFDDEGGIQGMVQSPPPTYDYITIPIERALLFRCFSRGNNPEGRSILRSAYRPWYFKKVIEETEAIGIERDLVGLPIITPAEGFDIDADENSGVRTHVQKLIANLRRDEQEGVFKPFGWTIELLSIGTSRRQFDTDRIINRYDKRIAAAMLAQFILLGMDRVGSFALSKDQNDLFLVAVQGYLEAIADVYNRFAVPRLMRLNPTVSQDLSGKYPRIVPSKVSEPNLKDLGTYIKDLTGTGWLTPTDTELRRELRRLSGGVRGQNEHRDGEIADVPGGEVPGGLLPALTSKTPTTTTKKPKQEPEQRAEV